MFSCDYCEYQIASSEILNIHNHTLHGKEERYDCDIICGCQLSNKISLATHKKIVHEKHLLWHKRAVHEGDKYP